MDAKTWAGHRAAILFNIHYYGRDLCGSVDQIVEILFKSYIDQLSDGFFLQLIFDNYNQEQYDISMKIVLDLYSVDMNPFPEFEYYVSLYHVISKEGWILGGVLQQIGKSHTILSVMVPEKVKLQELYTTYLDVRTYHDIMQFEWKMSSGENSLCLLFARLYDAIWSTHIRNEIEISYLLVIDEIDSLYHPRWQQKIVHWITLFLNYVFPWYEFQIIITTHSPVILSDIPTSNIIFLATEDTNKNVTMVKHCETFAANISTLYYDAFFMHEGSIGEIAKQNVDMLYEILSKDYGKNSYRVPNTDEDVIYNKRILANRLSSKLNDRFINEFRIDIDEANIIVLRLIDIIGEAIWKEQLRALYNNSFTIDAKRAGGVNHVIEAYRNLSTEERKCVLKEITKNDTN